jgi:ribokinase
MASSQIDVLVVGGIFREILIAESGTDVRVGGSGFTASLAAARMGTRVALVGYVGDEDAPVALRQLEAAGVDCQYILTMPGASGLFVFHQSDGDSSRPQYRPTERVPLALPECPPAGVTLVFGIPDYEPLSDPSIIAAITEPSTLVWDRQGWLSRSRDSSRASVTAARRKVYLANVGEAIDEGVIDEESGGLQLPAGFEAAVLKDGSRGCVVLEDGGTPHAIPAYMVRTASTIGSGDIFGGVLAAELAIGVSMVDAALHATRAASVVLQSHSTIPPPDLRALVRARQWAAPEFNWRWPLGPALPRADDGGVR